MFGIKKVAELTGIPPVTLRAWERRYDVIKPTRTEKGQRRYSQKDVKDLLWVKHQKEDFGIPVHQAMELLKNKVDEPLLSLPEREAEPSIKEQKPKDLYEIHIDRILEALVHYDTGAANQMINLCFSMFDFEDVFHYIIVPILKRVGDEWAQNRLSVIQEHFISQFLERRLLSFFQDLTVNTSNVRAVAFCPPNEHHHIGLLLFSLFLKRRGIDVLFLGENTPTEDLLPLIQMNNVKFICMSVTYQDHAKHLEKVIKELSDSKLGLTFIIGGQASPDISETLRPYVLANDLASWKKWFHTIAPHSS
ncbi:MerR family transcriptional regulator [Heyndrickxia acidicola]|uniref:MerR family transcriptional regulator n=1 Tax=Heyndrickxia acidicola TaxID=209389 RepID=A0ABU6MN99_9BACI|nr:MerR family transcriptional regulator [Heyndrickxia acidicola]MED1204677.1 MerR family transcriptional regulator [Heyndrickxia acidicola]